VIKKRGRKWVLYSKDGRRILGEHDTYRQALAQERAIMAKSKARRQRNRR